MNGVKRRGANLEITLITWRCLEFADAARACLRVVGPSRHKESEQLFDFKNVQ